MAFQIDIAGVPVRFGRIKNATDVSSVLHFIRGIGKTGTVLSVDLSANESLVQVIEALLEQGFDAHFVDHHEFAGQPRSAREQELRDASNSLHGLLNEKARITTRQEHPACSTLLNAGQFSHALAIIADDDADGLTAAMKAVGVIYPELDYDAACFDGPPAGKLDTSQTGQLLFRPLACCMVEEERAQLFAAWLAAISGDHLARRKLESYFPQWEVTARRAINLSNSATEVARGVLLVDAVEQAKFDLATLAAELEKQGCRVFVIRMAAGSTAENAYRVYVARVALEEVHLQDILLQQGFNYSTQPGIIAGGGFLLSVTEQRWMDTVYPSLQRHFER